MARGSDPDSRPISVAELLARAKEAGATDVAEAAANSPAATGRRHRGGKDGISVAELTGEIPRIAESSTPRSAESSTPPPTRDFNSADVSERAAAPDSGETKPTPAVSDEQAQEHAAPEDTTPEPAPQVTKPVADDQGPEQHSDNETTGVIASVQAYSQVDDSDPDRDRHDDHRVLSAAEREREFEAYRNFEDIDEVEAPVGEPKKKRGILGFGRKKTPAAAAQAVAAPDYPDETDHEVTQLIPMVTAPQPPTTTQGFAEDVPPAPVPVEVPDPAPSPPPGVAPADPGRYLRFDVGDEAPSRVDTSKRGAASGAADETASSRPAEANTRGFGAAASAAAPIAQPPADQSATVQAPATQVSDDDSAADATDDSGADAVRSRLTGSAAAQDNGRPNFADQGPGDEPADEVAQQDAPATESAEKSPSVQWLLLIGQVLAGLAVGVALFWGFTELWRWNVYFALILAVAVIFGLVTLVHVVRRSQDLISTLLALGVGLLVTIGPLVLLLVAGD